MMLTKNYPQSVVLTFCFFLILFSATIKAQNYQLVWSDEFDDATIDSSVWNFETGPTFETLHYYTDRPANATIVAGKLNIIALQESYQGYNYTSALLKTENIFSWRYGRIEARIKLPRTTGFVPAFWMLPQDNFYAYWPWSGEIDIMEHPTNHDRIFGTCHTWQYSYFTGSLHPAGSSIQVTDSETAFHLYAVEWSSDRIDFFVDDQKYFTFNNEHSGFETWPFDQPFYILFAVGVGGGWVGDPDETTVFPAVMEVDYVRVYQDLQDVIIYGPDYIPEGSPALSYYAPALDGAQYLWSVPNTAQIKSGQGTAQITVDWGFFSGDVELLLATNEGSRLIEFPVVLSNNLLKNSSFEKGAKYWNQVSGYPAEAIFTISTLDQHSGNKAMAVEVKTPGVNAWDVQLSQTNLSLKSGTNYSASLWAKSETNSQITAAVINSTSFFLYESKTIQLTNVWIKYEFSFQVSADVTASFNIDLGNHTGKYVFDDFQLTAPAQNDSNQVKNADFSAGDSGWTFNSFYPAVATAAVSDGELVVTIDNGGIYAWDVYVGQAGVTLEKGKEYTVSFDAYASAPRDISPLVGKNSDPWTAYSGSRIITLSTVRKSYSYSFIMNNSTDIQARIGFDIGSSAEDVFLDNVFLSLGNWPAAIEIQPKNKPHSFELFQNFPNPFNMETEIVYALPEASPVDLAIFNSVGQRVRTLVAGEQRAGRYAICWKTIDATGTDLPTGVYFCRLTAGRFCETRKMVLLR